MEDQFRAGEESDDEGESSWSTFRYPLQPVSCLTLCFLISHRLQCTYLEASNCQVESRYLGILRQLLETKSLDPVQRGAVQKLVEDALKREIKSFVKLHVAR